MIHLSHIPIQHRNKVQEIYDGGGVWEVVLKHGWINRLTQETIWIYNQNAWHEGEEHDLDVIDDLVTWFTYVEKEK